MKNKFLTVVGATGYLSVHIIRRLVEQGVNVKAVVRNLEKAKELLPESVELVYGDVEDPQSLDKAFEGSQALYIHLNTETLDTTLPFYQEREGVKNIVEAAKKNGVTQILQIAGIEQLRKDFSVKGEYLQTSLIRDEGMKYVRESGIPFTFFHCSFFIDSFPLWIQDDVFSVLGEVDQYPLWYINTTDYADTIYAAIDNPVAHNKQYSVQGKEGIDFKSAAQRFMTVFNPEGKVAQYPIAAVDMMGLPDDAAAFMKHVCSFVEQLKEEFISEDTWEQLSTPKLTIEEFATTCMS